MQWLFDIVADMMEKAGFIKMPAVVDYVQSVIGARCKIWANTAQSVPNITWSLVRFDRTSFENRLTADLFFERLRINFTGYYVICASASLNNMAVDKKLHTGIKVNGNFATYNIFTNRLFAEDPRILTLGLTYLEAGDYLELWVWHNHGVPRDMIAQEFSTWLGAHQLS